MKVERRAVVVELRPQRLQSRGGRIRTGASVPVSWKGSVSMDAAVCNAPGHGIVSLGGDPAAHELRLVEGPLVEMVWFEG